LTPPKIRKNILKFLADFDFKNFFFPNFGQNFFFSFSSSFTIEGVCVCVCVCVRERERDERSRESESGLGTKEEGKNENHAPTKIHATWRVNNGEKEAQR
jgi:hypothetical protein